MTLRNGFSLTVSGEKPSSSFSVLNMSPEGLGNTKCSERWQTEPTSILKYLLSHSGCGGCGFWGCWILPHSLSVLSQNRAELQHGTCYCTCSLTKENIAKGTMEAGFECWICPHWVCWEESLLTQSLSPSRGGPRMWKCLTNSKM